MPTKAQTPPPAYFLSLSLENVRSFGEKQTIHFTEGGKPDGRPAQWTIILGDNGVGKTTVLKSLAVVVPVDSSIEGMFASKYSELNNQESYWDLRRKTGQYEASLHSSALGNHLLSQKKVKNIFENEFYFGFEIPVSKKVRFLTQKLNSITQEPSIASLICYGYGAGRSVGNFSTLGASQNLTEDTCISLFDDRADLLNPEEWFLQNALSSYVIKGDAGRALQKFKTVRDALLRVLPDVDDIQIKSTEKHQQQLELLTPYGWVRLRDMSLGYQTLVVWLTDFASKLFIRYPDSSNPLEEPAIVLIDEIDLHLHPSWQRKLIGFLSDIFKNTQFIATAHSPLVVQAASDADANVVLLKREGDQTKVYQNPEDVRGWRVDQILVSSFFNLDTARSLKTEDKLARQAALLNKKKLTAKERQELESLTLELEGQPMGSTGAKAEQEEAELLRQITERLGTSLPDLTAGQ